MDNFLLQKYLSNCCDGQELNKVFSWFTNEGTKPEGKALFYKIWEELSEDDKEMTVDFDIILHRIHHNINLSQTRELIKEAEDDLIRFKIRQNFIRFLRNAAAILLLPVLCLGIYYSVKYYSENDQPFSVSQTYNEVFSSVDAITKVTLPDGSNVWLNHSSSLRYPAVFTGKCREVQLNGEGYFEVAHNPDLPFIVNTGEIQVVAIGTTFNVMAYPSEYKIETSLINGNVELKKSLPDGKIETLYKMRPTDFAIYNKNKGDIITKTIADERHFSWKEGKLIFTAEPMEEVIKKLNRWFNVDIQIKDKEIMNLTLTATFANESLTQVMELLAIVSNIKYSISERELNNDGTFTRKQVIISQR